MRTLTFYKVQGTGNDFVLIDPWPSSSPTMEPELVRAICDRHFGVGADGVLLVLPGDRGVARMRIQNADGSTAEMCGNGIRCFARHLAVRREETADELPIDTDAGLKRCRVRRAADGEITGVRVAMGAPALLGSGGFRPVNPDTRATVLSTVRRYTVGGHELDGLPVSMGNPHLVIFLPHADTALAAEVGEALVAHPDFPEGTNVELAALRADGGIDLIVYERGVGLTLACGTGACATATAACLLGHAAPGAPVAIHLPGGVVRVEVAPDYHEVWLEGPAEEVFTGTLSL